MPAEIQEAVDREEVIIKQVVEIEAEEDEEIVEGEGEEEIAVVVDEVVVVRDNLRLSWHNQYPRSIWQVS